MWERSPKKELKHKTEKILKKVKEAEMTINKGKCELNCDIIYGISNVKGWMITR